MGSLGDFLYRMLPQSWIVNKRDYFPHLVTNRCLFAPHDPLNDAVSNAGISFGEPYKRGHRPRPKTEEWKLKRQFLRNPTHNIGVVRGTSKQITFSKVMIEATCPI